MGVVVREVPLEGPLQVPASTTSNQSDTRRERCRPTVPRRRWRWCLQRRWQHLGVLGAEPLVQPATEPRVTVADNKASPSALLASARSRWRACWVIHAPSGWRSRQRGGLGGAQFDEATTPTAAAATPSHSEEVTCQDPGGLLAQERPPGGGRRRGVGSRPWRRSVVPIVVAKACTPSRRSSPWMRWSPNVGSPWPDG
jgi:hypothetical protein